MSLLLVMLSRSTLGRLELLIAGASLPFLASPSALFAGLSRGLYGTLYTGSFAQCLPWPAKRGFGPQA